MELTPLSYPSFFIFEGIFIFLQLWRVILGHLTLDLSFVLWFGSTFPLLQIHRSNVSLLLFKFLLDLDNVSIGDTKQGDVEEFHLMLNLFV